MRLGMPVQIETMVVEALPNGSSVFVHCTKGLYPKLKIGVKLAFFGR